MKLILRSSILAAAALSASFPLTSRAAELGTFDATKCNDQGGLGKGCAEVPTTLLLSMDQFNALAKARAPSNDEVTSAKKLMPADTGTFDPSKCNDQDGMGKGCAEVPTNLFLSMDQFNALANARPLSAADKNAMSLALQPKKQ